ncbi:MAG: MCP four helix bundle domain-containing protein [Lachnospiraceae bacterium]|nr:MCP four helix bundle domain-containing protein [Lachnospiraceae bacterium]
MLKTWMKDFENKLLNKKMQEKMSTSFSMVIRLMIACLIVAIVGLTYVSSKLKTFYQSSYNNVALAHSSYGNLQEGAKNLLHACLISDPDIVENRLALADTCFDKMKQELNDLKSTSFADKSVFDAMDGDTEVIDALIAQFRDYSRQNDIENAFIVYSQQMLSYFADISANITTIEEVEAENAAAMYKASQITKYICIAILVLAGVLSILLGRNVSAILSKALNSSTSELQAASVQMASGNFDVSINYTSEDELGGLADAMRNMVDTTHAVVSDTGRVLSGLAEGDFTVQTEIEEKYIGIYETLKNAMQNLKVRLSKTIQGIGDVADQVNTGAEQLAQSAQQLAEGATEQAGAIEELTAQVENVTNMTKDSAAETQKAAESIEMIADEAMQGQEEVYRLIDAMDKINSTSKEIENIITDIEDIASQTNLLSLNASIEAARAGEAGRGFAVVADQIGNLASSSAQSAVHTRELIAKALEEVSAGSRITMNTAEVLKKVLSSMDGIKENAKNSSVSSRQQVEMMNEILLGIEQISSVIQTNSAMAQQTSATSEELTSQSETLNSMVSAFKTNAS